VSPGSKGTLFPLFLCTGAPPWPSPARCLGAGQAGQCPAELARLASPHGCGALRSASPGQQTPGKKILHSFLFFRKTAAIV
jgi:hypothetical protein